MDTSHEFPEHKDADGESPQNQVEPATHATAELGDKVDSGVEVVGLLLTHGMGIQLEGDTLSDFGDPLLSWASCWLAGHGGSSTIGPSKTERSAACPFPGCPDVGGPLHTHVTWEMPPSTGNGVDKGCKENKTRSTQTSTIKLIVAESWWATEFKAPSASAVSDWLPSLIWGVTWRGLIWSVLFLAATVISIGRLTPDHPWNTVVPAIVIGGLLTLAGILIAPALLVVGALPFLATYTKPALDFLTMWVGDVLIYEKYPISTENARTKIRHDLDWLMAQHGMGRTVVAAHSLGTLLAVDVLTARGRTTDHSANNGSPPAASPVEMLVTFGSPIKLLKRGARRYVHDFDAACHKTGWLNLYDPLDFISGSIESSENFPLNLKIDNGQSMIRAHGAYPDNAEQFVMVLFRVVAGPHAKDAPPHTARALKKALRFRTTRSHIRTVIIGATAPALSGAALLLIKLGWPQALDNAVKDTKLLPDWVKNAIHAAVPAKDGAPLDSAAILCLVTAAAATCVFLWMVRLVFEWWESIAETNLSSDTRKTWTPSPTVLCTALALVELAAITAPFLATATESSMAKHLTTGNQFWFMAPPIIASVLIVTWIFVIRKVHHLKLNGRTAAEQAVGGATPGHGSSRPDPLDCLGKAFKIKSDMSPS